MTIVSWKLKKLWRERLQRERGNYIFPPGVRSRFALIYPNSYYVGMSNLGLHIIYDILNRRTDTACERFFLPERDELAEFMKSRQPLFSMETQTPLSMFPLIAFAVSFEMDYFHVLDILSLGQVGLLAAERGDDEPLVIAGGPCATFNPEPLSPFVDAFVIGEGEETMQRFMDTYYEGKNKGFGRAELLRTLAEVPGIYVPSLYEHQYTGEGDLQSIVPAEGAPLQVKRQWVKCLDDYPGHTVVVTDDTEFKLYLLETARGCGRHCRFCMAGYCFRKPRNRSLFRLKVEISRAKDFGKRIGFMGAAISDYPAIDELCRCIMQQGMSMSVASFRADSVTETLVASLAQSGMKTLTIAPEAGSARLRRGINKGIEEADVFRTVDLGLAAGIRHFRLYFMIGLPFETEADILAIADMVIKIRSHMREKVSGARLTVSVNPFVPKPFTPFQWLPMAEKAVLEGYIRLLRQAFKSLPDIELLTESVRESIVQAVLARGDRRTGMALFKAWRQGGAKAFLRAMKDEGLEVARCIYRERQKDEVFPWETVDVGVRRDYLYQELANAAQEKTAPKCFDGCRRCGVCLSAEE